MKSKLRRFAYVLGGFVLFLILAYICFTWRRLQG